MAEQTTSGNNVGTIENIQGEVFLITQAGEKEQLSSGDKIFQEDKIVTSDDGQVEIKFQDDTVLSLGKNSEVTINTYVYDPENGSNSNLLFEMGQGIFRTMTGEIAKQNPDHFNLKSPMALIGIRGTTVAGQVGDDSELWGVEHIGEGHVLVLQDQYGNIQFISEPGLIVDFLKNQPINPARPLTEDELDLFQGSAPIESRDDDSGQQNTDTDPDSGNTGDDGNGDSGDSDSSGDGDDQYYAGNDSGGGEGTGEDVPEGFTEELPFGQDTPPDQLPLGQDPVYQYLGLIDYTDPDDPVFYQADDSENDDTQDNNQNNPDDTDQTGGQTDNDDPPPPNTVPDAVDDTILVLEDNSATYNVLANDSDANGDPLSIASVTQGANGSVTISGSSIVYTPDPEFSGFDTFTYTVDDGQGGSDTATVSAEVLAVNDGGPAIDQETLSAETLEDEILNSSVTATDPDNDNLTYTLDSGPDYGTLVFNPDGTYTYTPDPDENSENNDGPDRFTFTVSDPYGETDSGEVLIHVEPVNDVPQGSPDTLETNEDNSVFISINDLMSNDDEGDVEGDNVSFYSFTQGGHGSVVENDGGLVYTPDADFFGTDTFTYTIWDDTGISDPIEITVTVDEQEDPPVADPMSLTINEGESILDGQVIAADPDGDPLTYEIAPEQGVSNGTLDFNTDGSFTYTPDEGFWGTDSFTYSVTDGHDNEDRATVDIVVNGLPEADDDYELVPASEDTEVRIAIADVLRNDSDPEEAPLNVTGVNNAQNGTVEIQGSDIVFTPDPDYFGPASFDYTIEDSNGSTDTATVFLDINPVNDDPVAVDDTITDPVPEDGQITIPIADLISNDSDIEGNQLEIIDVNNAQNGTVEIQGSDIIFTPDPDYFGPASFDYTLGDQNDGTDTGTVTLNVTPSGDPAQISGQNWGYYDEDATYPVTGTLNITDPDGTAEEAFIVRSAANPIQGVYGDLEITEDGEWTFYADTDEMQTLAYGQSEQEIFTVSSVDGTEHNIAIDVYGANDDPDAVDDPAINTDENTPVVINVMDNDTDIDGDTFYIYEHTQGANGIVEENDDGTLTYTPNTGFFGTDTFTYTIRDDNGGQDTAAVTVTVQDVSNPAAITVDPGDSDAGTVVEDNNDFTTATGTLSITDPDTGEDEFAPLNETTPYGTFNMYPSGTWTFDIDSTAPEVQGLAEGETVQLPFEVSSLDGTDTHTVTITITGTNDVPDITGMNNGYVEEDSIFTADGQLTVLDADDAQSEFLPGIFTSTYGDLGIDSTGYWTFTLDNLAAQELYEGQLIEEQFTVLTADQTPHFITISIMGTGDEPIVTGDFTGSVVEGDIGDDPVTATGSLSISDADGNNDPQFNDAGPTSGDFEYGTFELTSGQWTYTLDQSAVQQLGEDGDGPVTDSITFTATDGTTQEITVSITGTDDAPVVSGTFTGDVIEGNIGDDPVTAAGTLSIEDIDSETEPEFDGVEPTLGTNGYGFFELAGTDWTYTLNQSAVQDLAEGEAVNDHIIFTATDGTEQQVTVTITGTNDDPVVLNQLTDQNGEEQQYFSFTIPSNTFDDIDGDDLALDATLSDGSALPGWLIFDGTTFTGTPPVGTAGSIDVRVTADDGNGGSVSDVFNLLINPGSNQDPIAMDDYFYIGVEPVVILGNYDLLSNDYDPDGDWNDLSIINVDAYSMNGVEIYYDGSVVMYTPDPYYSGSIDEFWYEISDADGGTAPGMVIIEMDPNFMATEGDDFIMGTMNDDFIDGLGGNDEIFGDMGDDVLIGGHGNDILDGFDGDDILEGGLDNDVLFGGWGWDDLWGNEGDDELYGEDDPDSLDGGSGDDWLDGGDGNDTLYGGQDDDTLIGGMGSNYIDGGDGWDLVEYYEWNFNHNPDFAGFDIDLAAGTAIGKHVDGPDLFSDTLVDIEQVDTHLSIYQDSFVGNDDDNWIFGSLSDDYIDGGDGWDTVQYYEWNFVYDPDFAGFDINLEDWTFSGRHTDGSVLFSDTLINIEQIDTHLSIYEDSYIGNADDNWIFASLGDDYIDGGDGWDTVQYYFWNFDQDPGFAGFDINLDEWTFRGKDGDGATLFSDTLINIEQIDTHMSPYEDSFVGNADDNWIFASLGNDYIDGGDGWDTVQYYEWNFIHDPDFNGFDINLEDWTFGGRHTDGSVLFSDTLVNVEQINTDLSRLDDIYVGDSSTETIQGHDGNDELSGMGGNDILEGGSGNDSLYGGKGQDTLIGGEGDDSLYGGDDGSIDFLDGGAGNDLIDGGNFEGTDPLNFADYRNDVENTASPDQFNGIRADIVYDPYNYNPDPDFDASFDGSIVRDGWGDTDTLKNINRIIGSSYDDRISVDIQNDTDVRWAVYGMAGDDTLIGTEGQRVRAFYFLDEDIDGDGFGVSVNLGYGTATDGWGDTDTLVNIREVSGSRYNDNLIGTTGNDIFYGTLANDNIHGAYGGSDWITYGWFEFHGENVTFDIDLGYGLAVGTDNMGTLSVADDIIVSQDDLHGIDNAYGSWLDDTIIGNNNINILRGQDGDDELSGLGGDDILYGGSGNDILRGGDGYDTFISGDGSDILYGDGGIVNIADYSDNSDMIYVTMGHPSIGEVIDDPDSQAVYVFEDGSPWGDVDTLYNVPWIIGSAYNDGFDGDGRFMIYEGGDGSDTIDGNAWGNDPGGMVSYWHDPDFDPNSRFYINLNDTPNQDGYLEVTDGWGNVDQVRNIDEIWGTQYDDYLAGKDLEHNAFGPGAGNDIIYGGGVAFSDGYDGNTVIYALSPEAVYVELNWTGNRFDPTGDEDPFNEIEDISLYGYSYDPANPGTQIDTLYNINSVVGSEFDDVIRVGSSDATENDMLHWSFTGWAGSDEITGQLGIHSAAGYSDSPGGINVNLSYGNNEGRADDGWGFTDTLYNINSIYGSEHDDIIRGGASDNWLEGNGGDDLFIWSAGNDHIRGDEDNLMDTVSYADTTYLTAPGAIHVNTMLYEDGLEVSKTGFPGPAPITYTDYLWDIEYIIGTTHNDVYLGDGRFLIFEGGAGADIIDGGVEINGFDEDRDGAVSYWNDPDYLSDGIGINANLNLGAVIIQDGWGTWDSLDNIVGVAGTAYSDTFTGKDYDHNWFMGGDGADFLNGGLMDGWTEYHSNTAVYVWDIAGIDATLTFDGANVSGTVYDGWGDMDTLSNITEILGSEFDDVLRVENTSGQTFGFEWGLAGYKGADELWGDANEFVVASYNDDISGVYVDLYDEGDINPGNGYAIDGWGDTDLLYNINHVEGSDYDDIIYGNEYYNHLMGEEGDDQLYGMGGNDILEDEEGNDILDGGDGDDIADYRHSDNSIYASFVGNQLQVNDGYGYTDTLHNIELVQGSHGSDYFYGIGNDVVFEGREGNDYFNNADVSYMNDPSGVYADFQNEIVYQGIGFNMVNYDPQNGHSYSWDPSLGSHNFEDTLVNVEYIIGSAHDDILFGNDNRYNKFMGLQGNDFIHGGDISGYDGPIWNSAIYAIDPDSVTGELWWDDTSVTAKGLVSDGWGNVDGLTNINLLAGSDFDDSLTILDSTGNFTGQWYLMGLNGNDTLTGLADEDTFALYHRDPGSIYVDLSDVDGDGQVIVTDGWGGTDTLVDIHNIWGTEGSDTLIGDAQDNYLVGMGGRDRLVGNEGNDILDGGNFSGSNPGNYADYSGDDQYDPNNGKHGDQNDLRLIDSHYYDGIVADIHYNPASSNPWENATIVDGWGDTDILGNISRIKGSQYDDHITISITDDMNESWVRWYVWGNGGNDTITGTDGERVRVMYLDDHSAIWADLSIGMVHQGIVRETDGSYDPYSSGHAYEDTLYDIQAISGTHFDDVIFGSDNKEGFLGTLGSDYIDGNGEWDWISYGWLDAEGFNGLDINLENETAFERPGGSYGFTDTLIDLEEAWGSEADDIIRGNSGDNWLGGNDGNDQIFGGDGYDRLFGEAGDDILTGGTIEGRQGDTYASYQYDPGAIDAHIIYNASTGSFDGSQVFDGYGGTDTLDSITRIVGSAYDDMIFFDITDPDNISDIYWNAWGMEGDDVIQGTGGERVRALYFDDPGDVFVDLGGEYAEDGWGDYDMLYNIRSVSGSNFGNDTLHGNDSGTTGFFGSLGDDTIHAGQDWDWLSYSWLDHLDDFTGVYIDLDEGEGFVTGYDDLHQVKFTDDLISSGPEYLFEEAFGSGYDDTIIGNQADNWLNGGTGGLDTLTGNDGNDTFVFRYTDAIDAVTDFSTDDNGNNDILRFEESRGLEFTVQGYSGNDYTAAGSLNIIDPTEYKIIGVTDTVSSDWSNVATVFDNAINADSGNGINDSSYIVASNGTDARIYHWEGDANADNMVNLEELTHFGDLQGFNSIASLGEENFDIG